MGGERERGIEGVEMKKEGKNRRPVLMPASPRTSGIKKKATKWQKKDTAESSNSLPRFHAVAQQVIHGKRHIPKSKGPMAQCPP